MSIYGLFSPSVLGIMSQSHSMATIGTNVANVTTGGYKKTDTHFQTILTDTFANPNRLGVHSDIGGAKPKDFQRISQQGLIQSSTRDLDVAISGQGMFILEDQIDGSGERFYGRDGSFQMVLGDQITVTGDDGNPFTTREGYLADKNGLLVQGWLPNADGTFPSSGDNLSSLRIDPYVFTMSGEATTTATLTLNLPADDAVGDVEIFNMDIFDDLGVRHTITTRFTKTATPNRWDLDFSGVPGDTFVVTPSQDFGFTANATQELVLDTGANTITARTVGTGTPVAGAFSTLNMGDAIFVFDTTLNNGTYTVESVSLDGSAITLSSTTPLVANEVAASPAAVDGPGLTAAPAVFLSDGTFDPTRPTVYTIVSNFTNGGSTTFTLDVSTLTQFASGQSLTTFNFIRDGFEAADMRRVTFDTEGHVIAEFDTGQTRKIYKLALGEFINIDGLEARNGNVYVESLDSGNVNVVAAGVSGFATFNPNARELSNADIGEEFTNMIKTQTVYTFNTTVFRTVDEMTEVARDLKR